MVSYGQNLLFLKKSVNYFLDIMKDASSGLLISATGGSSVNFSSKMLSSLFYF